MNNDYKIKYLKYKAKYINLKNLIGGSVNKDVLDTIIPKYIEILQKKLNTSYSIKVLLPGDNLKKTIKGLPKTYLPFRKLPANHFFIYVTKDDNWVSFIDVFNNDEYAKYDYSFTREEHRRLGLSKILRLLVIEYAKTISLKKIVSVPFLEAHSKPLLDNFDFIKGEGHSVYLNLTELNLKEYIDNKLG